MNKFSIEQLNHAKIAPMVVVVVTFKLLTQQHLPISHFVGCVKVITSVGPFHHLPHVRVYQVRAKILY